MFKWTRRVKRGEPYYEVSSKGDKTFSALYAKIKGKSIEEIYQLDIKGYRGKVKHWKYAKGKPPIGKTIEEAYLEYKALWKQYIKEKGLLQYLRINAEKHNCTLTDMFATSEVNQARALAEILNENKIIAEKTDILSVEKCNQNPDKIYVFGDNLIGNGKGGQAIIRDCKNSFGIPTKRLPCTNTNCYFSDKLDEELILMAKLNNLLELASTKVIVFPTDGLGTGMADMYNKSPKLFKKMNKFIKEKFGLCF